MCLAAHRGMRWTIHKRYRVYLFISNVMWKRHQGHMQRFLPILFACSENPLPRCVKPVMLDARVTSDFFSYAQVDGHGS